MTTKSERLRDLAQIHDLLEKNAPEFYASLVSLVELEILDTPAEKQIKQLVPRTEVLGSIHPETPTLSKEARAYLDRLEENQRSLLLMVKAWLIAYLEHPEEVDVVPEVVYATYALGIPELVQHSTVLPENIPTLLKHRRERNQQLQKLYEQAVEEKVPKRQYVPMKPTAKPTNPFRKKKE
jgi:hypothetical protein